MAKQQTPKTEMPEFGERVEAALDAVRRAFEGDADGALATVASVAGYRARRLGTSEARLTEELGKDHPRVAALRARREHLAGLERGFVAARKRQADEQPLRPGRWLATGRVIDETGEPLAGFRVIVYDADKGPDDPLGDELTDEAGEFRAEYHTRDFADEDKSAPDLSLVVFDRSRKLVLESDESVPANPSHRDRFEIMLTRERLEQGADRKMCEATTANGEPCRNRARPGSRFCSAHTGSAG